MIQDLKKMKSIKQLINKP